MRSAEATWAILILALSGQPAWAKGGTMHPMQILSAEPPIGKMHMQQVIFVDDHSCPPGQIKMVAAPLVYNGPRRRSCVPH